MFTPRHLAPLHDAITAYATDNPDATVDEYRVWLMAEHGVYASAGLMWNTLHRLGLTLKKVLRAARADIAEACRVWREL